MDPLLRSGIPFEIAGLAYFVIYLLMQSRRHTARFSGRSKLLTLVAAIALVAAVPLAYGDKSIAIVGVLGLAGLALFSAGVDRRSRG